MKATVISLLEEGYSPEQIKGRSDVEGFAMVSHETIYRWIWKDKLKKGTLYLHLRRKGKKYNKRGNFVTRTILGNVVLMRTVPKRDLVISQQTRNLIYY